MAEETACVGLGQVKTQETDGYSAVQVGYKVSKEKHINKPELGHLAKAGAEPLRHLAEWRVSHFPSPSSRSQRRDDVSAF
jgi:ribosomal protein L3